MIAAIDDSAYWDETATLFLYSHALVTADDIFTLSFFGTKRDIYSHGEEILELILDNLPTGAILYGCPHYKLYPDVWKAIYLPANIKHIPREAKKLFRVAHDVAKHVAKNEFEMRLREYLQK